jgi:DNA-binding CsgD family transcriptional regulator/transposase
MSSAGAKGPGETSLSDRAVLRGVRAEYRRADNDHDYRRRLAALRDLLTGQPAATAAHNASVSVRTLRRWLATSRTQGVRTLRRTDDQILNGLSDKARRRLIEELSASPRAVGMRRDAWGGGTLALHLKRRYGLRLSVRHCRRLLRQFGIVGASAARAADRAPLARREVDVPTARFRSEQQIRRENLKRIQRMASCGLPLHSFLTTALDLLEEAIPSGPDQAFVSGPDHTMVSPRLIARGFDPVPDALLQYGPETAGPEISGMIPPPGPLSPTRPVLRHHEVTLPHFYRSAGYNEIFRKNLQHHALSLGWIENGRMDFRCSIWRSEQMKEFSEPEVQFAAAIASHIAHGIRVARALTMAEPSETEFAPLRSASGILYLDENGRLRGMDARAEEILSLLGAFDDYGRRFFSPDGRAMAFASVEERLRQIFIARGDADSRTGAPCAVVRFSNSGLIARLSGFALSGADHSAGFGIIVELGESPEIARRRMRYRWGLSRRQAQILELLAGPGTIVQSAHTLNISPGTLRSHIRDILDRLEVGDLETLREFARRQTGLAA